MICPQCKKEGKKSKVYPGVGSCTLMYYSPFYDENGKYHHHDSNTITTGYSCSNGHEWTEKSSDSCWCGWPDKKEPRPATFGVRINKKGELEVEGKKE